MKFIALFLSITVMTLSIMPCCSDALETKEIQALQKERISHHAEEHCDDDDSCQHCSPFYSCGTCPGFVWTNVFVFDTGFLLKHYQIPFPVYLRAKLQTVFSQIWQPPKIS